MCTVVALLNALNLGRVRSDRGEKNKTAVKERGGPGGDTGTSAVNSRDMNRLKKCVAGSTRYTFGCRSSLHRTCHAVTHVRLH